MRYKRRRINTYLDLAPLIDCVFLLLIFFLLTSSFIEEAGFEINLPTAGFAKDLRESSTILYVDQKEHLYLNGKNIYLSDLEKFFLKHKKPLIIKAHRDVRLEVITQVMDLAKSLEVEKLSIATIKE